MKLSTFEKGRGPQVSLSGKAPVAFDRTQAEGVWGAQITRRRPSGLHGRGPRSVSETSSRNVSMFRLLFRKR
jgi:hypothetical protein